MKPLATLITAPRPPAPPTIRSERAELVQKFTDRLNEGRAKDGFKPLTPRAVAVKIAHLDTSDLYFFFKQCSQAKSFGARFWWALKPESCERRSAAR